MRRVPISFQSGDSPPGLLTHILENEIDSKSPLLYAPPASRTTVLTIEYQPTRKLNSKSGLEIENSWEAGPLELARSAYRSTLEDKILAALKRSRLSTRDLADALGEPLSRISYYCRKLELKSDLEQGPRLLFCVDEQQVVGSGRYETCKEEEHELRFFYAKIRIWRLDASQRA